MKVKDESWEMVCKSKWKRVKNIFQLDFNIRSGVYTTF